MKNITYYAIISVVLSLLLHGIFLLCMGNMTFSATVFSGDPATTPLPPVKVHVIPENGEVGGTSFVRPDTREEAERSSREALAEESWSKMRDVFQREELINPPPLPTLSFDGVAVDKVKLQPKLPDTVSVDKLPTAPRPQVVEIKMQELTLDRRVLPRLTVPKMVRQDVSAPKLPSLLPHGDLMTERGAEYHTGLTLSARPTFGPPPSLEGDGVSGHALPGGSLSLPALRVSDGSASALPTVVALDDFVDVDVETFRDSRGKGYFRVKINANDKGASLGDIPKDTLLIIDHSASISYRKLEQFKAGAIAALGYLNPEDRFNIVSFTSRAQPLFTQFAKANDINRQVATKYISRLSRGGQTDVFGGIGPFVQMGNGDLQRPLNIFVLTDGKSTVDIHKMDNREINNRENGDILRALVGVNPGNVSIYPFSAGKDANRMLLDFIGYLNCGRNEHVEDLKNFQERLVSYINNYSTMIVRDMRYLAEGKVSDNIYPRKLPHLYRNETLELYGSFEPEDQELVLTLSGVDAKNQRRDLVFRRRYEDCAQGSPLLAQQWAAQKILHLRAEITLCTDEQKREELIRQSRKLASAYDIMMNY